MLRDLDEVIHQICHQDQRYKEDAYEFVLEALSFAQRRFKKQRHVTGKELLEGTKILLLEKFGPFTLLVLKHWGIDCTDDFGHIVFNLVEKKILSKTEEDNIESFHNVFDFEVVFKKGYRQGLEKKISRMR